MTEGRYRPLLCLTQVSVLDGADVLIGLLDPLAGDDPGPLPAVLADPAIEIIMHAGRQDVGILRRAWDTEVTNIFDTQVAAAFAGLGAQIGYAPLLERVVGVSLDKSASFTRWDQRPLSDEQLSYARGDVADLFSLHDDLVERLEASGRLAWAKEECAVLEAAREGREPEEAYRRLPRSNQLRPKALAVARELAAWRERVAASEDRPVGSILGDAPLVEMAKRQPRDASGLSDVRGLHPPIVRKRGDEIIAAVARGLEAGPLEQTGPRRQKPDRSDAPLIALAEALVRQRTNAAEISYELVASRSELDELVAVARAGGDAPDVRPLRGWRREMVGEDLLALLAGRLALSVDPQGGLRVVEN